MVWSKTDRKLTCTKCKQQKVTSTKVEANKYVCRKCKSGAGVPEYKPKEDKVSDKELVSSVKLNTDIHNGDGEAQVDMTQLVPKTDMKYITRRVGQMNDMNFFKRLYDEKRNLLIIGETGSGKTMGIRHFCYTNQLPYKRLNLNGGSTTEDLLGQTVQDKYGKFKWVDGWLTLFARQGGVLVLDEVNACPAEITTALHSITDDERTITLTAKDGELIHAHKDFWVVMTMNPDYEGTKPLNLAFKDRFEVINWDYDDRIEKALKVPDKLRKIAKKLRVMYKEGELTSPVSTRTLVQYNENVKLFGENTAKMLFLNKFTTAEDRQVVEEIFALANPNEYGKNKQTKDEDDEDDSY